MLVGISKQIIFGSIQICKWTSYSTVNQHALQLEYWKTVHKSNCCDQKQRSNLLAHVTSSKVQKLRKKRAAGNPVPLRIKCFGKGLQLVVSLWSKLTVCTFCKCQKTEATLKRLRSKAVYAKGFWVRLVCRRLCSNVISTKDFSGGLVCKRRCSNAISTKGFWVKLVCKRLCSNAISTKGFWVKLNCKRLRSNAIPTQGPGQG